MKYILIFIVIIMALLVVNLAFSHFNGNANSGFGIARNHGMMGYHLMDEYWQAEEYNTMKVRETNGKISEIRNEISSLNIETYTSAKLILTREQFNKVNTLGIFDIDHMHIYRGTAGCW